MRHKLRPALMVTLASLSALGGVLMVASLFWQIGVVAALPQTELAAFVQDGCLSVQQTDSIVEHSELFVFVAFDHRRPFLERFGNRRTWNALLFRINYLSGGQLGPPFYWWIAVPMWIPTMAFGLWPGIVAAKALRHRRWQVQGFDVTPPGN